MRLRTLVRAAAGAALAATLALFTAPTGQAAPAAEPASDGVGTAASGTINVFPPIQGASTWDRFGLTPPASHHRVFSNWGYLNDWSVDIYRNPGAAVVSPFGTTTSAGHPVSVTVVTVRAGCATGNLADGGYLIGLEAKDTTTGEVIGRADVMHVDNKPAGITVGATVGPWTKLGETGRFRYSSCYQVNGDSGAHIHLEVINRTRYSCYISRSAGTELNDLTVVGRVGTQNTGPQQAC
ncbi:hypothetical protein SAMN06297387_12449 [Streptomyces zhaozhouensis]|uniref:Peptidase family M23 n=1 Tax=Streptomyces zhaozhouensis TaxID=1300267 RepID=A0A286E562_9ACTN|nr:hypothetical protein [Streptomyces zhaozhouensis]SOD66050.1 hypothetical protein SAMN06297387_12449 [Streptomyces zhaozhouensis]